MSKTEKVITSLQGMGYSSATPALHPVAFLLVTLSYLVCMLSVPVGSLSMLLWYGLYPIVMSAATGCDFNRLFLKSLVALPFAALIGVFNPIFQTEGAFRIGNVVISRGWASFVSIIIRAVYSVQVLLLLVMNGGFIGFCRSLRKIGMPSVLTTQLLMVYRYLEVLLQESLDMSRARKARGYGKRNFDLKTWGTLCGQLFIRTVVRSQNIHRAMLARGFDGALPAYNPGGGVNKVSFKDIAFMLICIGVFAAMRLFDISKIFSM